MRIRIEDFSRALLARASWLLRILQWLVLAVLRFLASAPVLLALGTTSISTGLWFAQLLAEQGGICRPLAPIFLGIMLIAVAIGLATGTPIPIGATRPPK